MPSKKIIKKKTKIKTSTYKNVSQKISYYKCIVQNTILSIQKYKSMDIITASDLNICVNKLQDIHTVLTNIDHSFTPKCKNVNTVVQRLQDINNEITVLFQKYGTDSINTMLSIVFGQTYLRNPIFKNDKMKIINKFLHPINYKIFNWSTNDGKVSDNRLPRNKIVEDFMIVETANTLDCFDLSRTSNIFQLKVYGIKICFQNPILKKTLLIQCIVDDVLIACSDDNYIIGCLNELYNHINNDFDSEEYKKYVSALSLKEILIYNNKELFHKFVGFCNQNKAIKQKTIAEIIKDFLSSDLYKQRNILMQLLLKNNDPEFQYLSYLLYDLLSNENNGSIDTQEQTLLFDSFPWSIKKFFKNAMKNTINYTKEISDFESCKIPLEQQICLLKADNIVKEKAMVKLKEIKAKTEDSGSKARAYLEGLLKIPFGIFKTEQILNRMDVINNIFHKLIVKIKDHDESFQVPINDKYTNNNIVKYTKYIKDTYVKSLQKNTYITLINNYINHKRDTLIHNICYINNILKKNDVKKSHLCHSGKKTSYMKEQIQKTIRDFSNNPIIFAEIQNKYKTKKNIITDNITTDISKIYDNWKIVCNEMDNISNTLEEAVHGHKNAKRQIERIIGQWISGKQTGYCFGFEGAPGVGKCIKKGTPIMLSNGKIKKVENIKVGDKIMGDDSAPRNILALGRGREKMYEIKPVKGDSYTVNESHILSLKMTKKGRKGDKHQLINGKRYWKNDIVDICIKDYLKLPKSQKSCLKGYRVPINFPEKKVDLDPYVLGYWLGDGNSNAPVITTEDEPVVEYFRYYCEDLGLKLHQSKDSETTRHSLHYRMSGNGRKGGNPMTNMLRKYNLLNNKHIPHVYKCNSKDIQLELLAGIIDSDGSLANSGYDVIQKNERLLDDIIFLARSLGFAAYKKKCQKSCMYKGEKKTGTYYRTNIHGEGVEYIPVKLERKKANKRKQIKNALNTGITVVKREVDEYYGFEIDGNRRFVLGDFTVTHNTVLGLNIISKLKKKTLIIVHKEFLVRQWVERIEQFLPKARVGKIQASVIDIEDKDIVIGMLQSLSMKEYDQKIFNEFGFTIIDEVHRVCAEVFSRVLFKVVTPYALGLSATMKRKDGLTKVIKMFLGEVVYKLEREKEDNVVVKAINYYLDDEEFLELKLNFRQQVNYAAMMKKLCELNHRREFILKVIEDLVENGGEDTQIMVLGHYKTILTYIYEAIKHRGIGTVGYYIGGMKEIDLKKSEGKKIIIATYAMASEGLDIGSLTTLVMATPKSDVIQSIGRILRKKRKESLVIDIVDPHIIFQRQYTKRKSFYKKQKFQLKETTMDGYYKDEWDIKLDNNKSTKKCTKKNTKNSPFLNGVCLIKDD